MTSLVILFSVMSVAFRRTKSFHKWRWR